MKRKLWPVAAIVLCAFPVTAQEGGGAELAWRLLRGTELAYSATVDADPGEGGDEKAVVSVVVRAPRDGAALVDVGIVEGGKGQLLGTVDDARTVVTAAEGVDPDGGLSPAKRELLRLIFPPLPGGPVEDGREWEIDLKPVSPAAQPDDGERTRVRVTGVEDGQATLDFSGGGVSGEAVFDVEAGVYRNVRLEAKGDGGRRKRARTSVEVELEGSQAIAADTLPELDRALDVRRAVGQAIALSTSDLGAALQALEPAVADDPGSEHAALVAAQLYSYQGRWQEARRAVELELERNPDNSAALAAAELVLQQLGDYEGAAAMSERMQQLTAP